MSRCRRCNRVLKTEPWASQGIGKICASKESATSKQGEGDNDQIVPYDGGNIFMERLTEGHTASGLRTNIQRYETKHSPTGFNFGYGGSGPADAALNIMLMFCKDRELAHSIYQDFKFKFLGKQGDRLEIAKDDILKFIMSKKIDKELEDLHLV